jgi:hypothetical protein
MATVQQPLSMEASPSTLSSRAHPDFLLRGTKDDHVCGFHQGKPHELCGTHRTQQEIRAQPRDLQFSQLHYRRSLGRYYELQTQDTSG